MRTTVDIDPHLLERLRTEAHRRGVSFKDLLNRVLHRGLEEKSESARRPYQCPTYSMGRVHPLGKALALAETLEDEETARELTLRKSVHVKVVDLNLLLYAVNRDSAHHALGKAWLGRVRAFFPNPSNLFKPWPSWTVG